ncbi:GumC family protein [uncultured Nitratireductor sp.]|uniref:GumC family protein n=1 Tax=uncultured Nitratireductor sp. TaxID=520953 RepID=UPI0025F76D81|nr:GumC family protein [uncultured Nitratireductor sp.]
MRRRTEPEEQPHETPDDEDFYRSPVRAGRTRSANSRPEGKTWRPLIDPVEVIGGIFRAKWLILLTTIIGAVLGVIVALSTPKMYYAATQIVFDPRNLQLVERDLTPGALPSDATLALIENQVAIMTSGNVLARVVDDLDLADDPEFNGTGGGSLLSTLLSPRALISALINGGDDDGGTARHAIAVENLAEALDVGRNAKTFIITIGAITKDPEKSSLIATTTRDVFLSTYGELQSATAGRANREITDQLATLRAEVEQAERAVADFKAKNDIVDAQGRLITDEEILRLNEQLSTARARTSELNARAAAARTLDVETVLGGALPEQIASPVMTELLAQYSSLRQQAGRLAVRLGPRHPDRLSVEAELSGAREEIARELRRVVASNQVELQRAVQLEQDLSGQLARLKVEKGDMEGERVTLRELEREANAKRSVYESLLLRARETGQQERLNTANVSVISQAVPPLKPIGPSRSSIAMAGTILGFLLGVGLGATGGAIRSLRENMAERQAGEDDNGGGNSGFDGYDPEPDPAPTGGGARRRASDDRLRAGIPEGRSGAWKPRSGERYAMTRAGGDLDDEDGLDDAFASHMHDETDGIAEDDPVRYRAWTSAEPQTAQAAQPVFEPQPMWQARQAGMYPGTMPAMAPMQRAMGMPTTPDHRMPIPTPVAPAGPGGGSWFAADRDDGNTNADERFSDIRHRLKAVRREVDALTARRSNRHRY